MACSDNSARPALSALQEPRHLQGPLDFREPKDPRQIEGLAGHLAYRALKGPTVLRALPCLGLQDPRGRKAMSSLDFRGPKAFPERFWVHRGRRVVHKVRQGLKAILASLAQQDLKGLQVRKAQKRYCLFR